MPRLIVFLVDRRSHAYRSFYRYGGKASYQLAT
jgi:hypothetical protein